MDRPPTRTHRPKLPGDGVNALSSRIAVAANAYRAVATVLLLFLSLSTMPAGAGRYVLIKQSAPGESYAYSDVPGGVCEAYEKNLARFAYEPYGMACGRKLDPALGFTRPRWEKLDVFKHAGLVHEIFFALRWEFPGNPIHVRGWTGLRRQSGAAWCSKSPASILTATASRRTYCALVREALRPKRRNRSFIDVRGARQEYGNRRSQFDQSGSDDNSTGRRVSLQGQSLFGRAVWIWF